MQVLKTSRGNSLIEYVLPTVVFVAVAIMAMNLLGDRMGDFFLDVVNAKQSGGTANVKALGDLDIETRVEFIRRDYDEPLIGEMQVCTPNYCVDMPIVEAGTSIETAGGNGTNLVNAFTQTLLDLIAELEEEGADPDLIALIRQLAAEGQSIGDIMALIDDSYASVADAQAALDAESDGGVMTPEETEANAKILYEALFEAEFGYIPEPLANSYVEGLDFYISTWWDIPGLLDGSVTSEELNAHSAGTISNEELLLSYLNGTSMDPALLAQLQASLDAARAERDSRQANINLNRFRDLQTQISYVAVNNPELVDSLGIAMEIVDSSASTIETLAEGASTGSSVSLTDDVALTRSEADVICEEANDDGEALCFFGGG